MFPSFFPSHARIYPSSTTKCLSAVIVLFFSSRSFISRATPNFIRRPWGFFIYPLFSKLPIPLIRSSSRLVPAIPHLIPIYFAVPFLLLFFLFIPLYPPDTTAPFAILVSFPYDKDSFASLVAERVRFSPLSSPRRNTKRRKEMDSDRMQRGEAELHVAQR